MVKFVVIPILIVVLAMHTPANAFGLVRVDIQKDNSGVQFANAIGQAISSKIQSWNSILNSLLQVKYSYGTVGGSAAGSSTSSTSGTGGLNFAPLYQKTVNIVGGPAPTRPPAGRVAASLDVNDEDNEITPSSSSSSSLGSGSGSGSGSVSRSGAIGGTTLVTVNKSLVPLVSVSTVGSAAPVASGSATVGTSVSVPSSVGYTYRKRYITN